MPEWTPNNLEALWRRNQWHWLHLRNMDVAVVMFILLKQGDADGEAWQGLLGFPGRSNQTLILGFLRKHLFPNPFHAPASDFLFGLCWLTQNWEMYLLLQSVEWSQD